MPETSIDDPNEHTFPLSPPVGYTDTFDRALEIDPVVDAHYQFDEQAHRGVSIPDEPSEVTVPAVSPEIAKYAGQATILAEGVQPDPLTALSPDTTTASHLQDSENGEEGAQDKSSSHPLPPKQPTLPVDIPPPVTPAAGGRGGQPPDKPHVETGGSGDDESSEHEDVPQPTTPKEVDETNEQRTEEAADHVTARYEIETVALGSPNTPSLEVIRRGHELIVETPRSDETTYKTLGEYAIHPASDDQWQLISAEQWPGVEHFDDPSHPGSWANAETLRTRAGEGTFPPAQMDLIETALVENQRLTSADNRLVVASEEELDSLLDAYGIETNQWRETGFRDLYRYVGHSEAATKENVTLHNVGGKLWLASAQAMVNVYRTTADGGVQKLQETWKTHYDMHGNPQTPVRSTIRSSIGETGHLIHDQPERPYDTARRGLREELGIEDDDDILQITSTGSLLRQKPRGHHRFPPIKAEDHTHYFAVRLNPARTHEEYLNQERDPSGQVHTEIKLEWFDE